MTRFEILLAQYTDGTLAGDDARELLALLKKSPDRRRALLNALDFGATLGLTLGRDPDAFADDVFAEIETLGPGQTTRFEERVMQAIETAAGPAALKTPAATRATRARPRPARLPTTPTARSAWGWRITALAAAALIAVGLIVRHSLHRLQGLRPAGGFPAGAVAQARDVTEPVYLTDRAGSRTITAGAALGSGSRLTLGTAHSEAVLVWHDDSTIHIRYGADITITSNDKLMLAAGTLTAKITPRPAGGTPLRVSTPHATISVLGTEYEVAVSRRKTDVHVRQGKVRVAGTMTPRTAVLSAGESASVGQEFVVGGGAQPGKLPPGLIARYTFRDGAGRAIRDSAPGAGPSNLTITGHRYQWLPGGGLEFVTEGHETIAVSRGSNAKFYERCLNTQQLTVELWFQTADIAQSDAKRLIVFDDPLGKERNRSNWAVTQANPGMWGTGNVEFRLSLGPGEKDQFVTKDAPLKSTTRPYHVVCTFAAGDAVRIYVNGQPELVQKTSARLVRHGANAWDPNASFGIGNRSGTLDRGWAGKIFFAAVYERALSPEEVRTRYRAGLPAGRALSARP